MAITADSRGIRSYISGISGDKKYRSLAATHPVALAYLTFDDAKVLLFFDMNKFFGKKMQEMVVFWKISAKIGKFRSKNPVFRAI